MSTQTNIKVLSLALMAVVATAAMAQDGPASAVPRGTVRNHAMQPRAAEPPARWPMVRLADGTEGELADVPARQNNALAAERGPDGRYRVRHAGDVAAAAGEAAP